MKPIVVLISAGSEWRETCRILNPVEQQSSPLGEWFETTIAGRPLIFFRGGVGKISAAATTQHAIDRWQPQALINLGTCGGFAGRVNRLEVTLVEKTVVYDIIEQMSDADAAIARYTTTLDLSWLKDPLPTPVRRGVMVSADRDLIAGEVEELHRRYGAVVGDWESGAIAWVAARHGLRCLILRGVTDLVGPQGGEAYGWLETYHRNTALVMQTLLEALPAWLERLAELPVDKSRVDDV